MKNVTITRTFRLESDVLSRLGEIVGRDGGTINALVNSILKKYAFVDCNMERYGIITLSRGTFIEMLNCLEDEVIILIAQKCSTNFLEFSEQLSLPNGFPAFCHIMKNYLCDVAKWANYQELITSYKEQIILTHNYGEKWSLFLKHYVWRLLTEYKLGIPLDQIKVMKNSIVIPFPPKTLRKRHPIELGLDKKGDHIESLDDAPINVI